MDEGDVVNRGLEIATDWLTTRLKGQLQHEPEMLETQPAPARISFPRFDGQALVLMFHLIVDIAHEAPGIIYFHVLLDKETRALVLVNLHKVEAILKGHIARFPNITPEGPIALP